MRIDSPVLGAIEVAEDKIIEFPQGLAGFEGNTRYALLHDEDGGAGLFMLQSVDDPELMFSVTGPESLGIHYEFELDDGETAALGLGRPEQANVLVILRKAEDEADTPAGAGLRANFMAPLVINAETRRGLQKVIPRLGCEITLRALG